MNILRLAGLTFAAFVLTACGGSNDSTDEPGVSKIERSNYERISDMALGNPRASVTVIEYASVTCPHCAVFHETVFPHLKENYIDTGKVRFIFREFPTQPAQLAMAGFFLARCVAEKNGDEGYFAMLDVLFKKQKQWISQDAKTQLLSYSTAAGLTEEQFNACVSNQAEADRLNADVQHGIRTYNIAGTPSFVVNGKLIPMTTIEAIDETLKPLLNENE